MNEELRFVSKKRLRNQKQSRVCSERLPLMSCSEWEMVVEPGIIVEKDNRPTAAMLESRPQSRDAE